MPRPASSPATQAGLIGVQPPLPWSDWWVTAAVLAAGLSLAYVPYIFQGHDGGLPAPGVRLVGLGLAVVALVLMADGLLGLPHSIAAAARLLVPLLLAAVTASVGSPTILPFQLIVVATVAAVLLLGPPLHARGLNVFLATATALSSLTSAAFFLYRSAVPPPDALVFLPVLTGSGLALVSVLLLLALAGPMPARLLAPTYLLAALVWLAAAYGLTLGRFMLGAISAVALALALAAAPFAPPVRRDRSLGEVLVLGMVFAAMVPLLAVCSLGTMAWQTSEERRTESLLGLLARNGARAVGEYVRHSWELVDGLRWREDVVEAVQRWDEARLARILAAALQATDALDALVVLDPGNRIRARFGATDLRLGDLFPNARLPEETLAVPRTPAVLGNVFGLADAAPAAVSVALRRPDGSAAALIVGILPSTRLAEVAGARNLGQTGAVLLLDRRTNRVVAHPDPARVGTPIEALPQAEALRALDSSGDVQVSRNGPWLVTRHAAPGLSWEVVAVQDTREALAPVNWLGAAALAVTLLFAVLLGASGLLVGRRLVRPVHALELLAFQDPLTGLATRRFFIAWLMQTLELARRYQQPLSLIFLDLDNFKQVNDRYGHLVGDRVLQEVAARVRSGLRASDLVVRYGGEEIVAALPQTGKEAALHVADTLRRAIADSPVAWDTNGEPVTITVSAGVASVPDDASDAHSLLERTDAALYLAKAQGRDRVVPA